MAYVRPHDIDISRENDGNAAFKAAIHYIHAVGPVVRLELLREDDSEVIEAELPRERFDALGLEMGEQVYLRPRNLRVFLQDA